MKRMEGKRGGLKALICLALSLALTFSLALLGGSGSRSAYAVAGTPVVEVSTGEEFDAAIKAADGLTIISLQNDIDAISSATYSGRQIIIEGNNHTLSGVGPGTNTGLRFTQARGAGAVLNDITIRNLALRDLSSNLRYGSGAVGVYQGKLTIENCAFIDNSNTAALSTSLTNGGGAVLSHNANNTLTITNSTFVGNSANMSGGAILSRGPATINNCTIVNNVAGIYGGGVVANASTLITLRNSIVVGNEVLGGTVSGTSYSSASSDVLRLTDGGHNLLGVVEPYSATDPTPSVAVDDTTATGKTRANLYLAASIADNGVSGATRGTGWTLRITNASSLAIGGADVETAALTDQRGYLRDSTPDIGAYEYNSDSKEGILTALRTFVDETTAAYDDDTLAGYTTAARASLAAALENAEVLLALDQSEVTVEAAYDVAWALLNVVSQLPDAKNALIYDDILGALLASDDFDTEESDYTSTSYQALAAAILQAQAIIDSPQDCTATEAGAAYTALVEAKLGLVRVADLTALIAYAQEEIATDKYVTVSVDYVTEILDSAEALLARGDASQLEIQAATDDLLNALSEYFFEKGDKTSLTSLVAIIAAQSTSLYTPDSVATLTDALEAANAVLADDDALNGDIEDAYEGLIEATGKLVLQANKSALGASITKANQILADSDRYVASSLVDLNVALPDALTAYENANASQAVVDSQTSALNTALAKVRVIANKSRLQELYDLLSPITPASYTSASFQVFSLALNNARTVLEVNDDVVTQTRVDEATETLQTAYNGLVRLPVENGGTEGTETGGTDDGVGNGITTDTTNTTSTTNTTGTTGPATIQNTANNSQGLAAGTNVTAVPTNTDTEANTIVEQATDTASVAETSNVEPSTQALADALVPLASGENAQSSNWLILASGIMALALVALFLVFLRKRQHLER
jgi:hypothetical protein